MNPPSKKLTQEVNSNNVDGEEPHQSKKKKRSLQDQLEEVKKKWKKDFYASKKSYLKDDNTNSSQDLYPRNTIVIAGDSITNGVIEDRLRCKNHVVKVQNFWKNPSRLNIHAGTNDAKRFTSRESLNQLLNLKKIVSEQVADCKVLISTPTVRSDDGKARLTVSQLSKSSPSIKN